MNNYEGVNIMIKATQERDEQKARGDMYKSLWEESGKENNQLKKMVDDLVKENELLKTSIKTQLNSRYGLYGKSLEGENQSLKKMLAEKCEEIERYKEWHNFHVKEICIYKSMAKSLEENYEELAKACRRLFDKVNEETK